jgi:hypothetical protein
VEKEEMDEAVEAVEDQVPEAVEGVEEVLVAVVEVVTENLFHLLSATFIAPALMLMNSMMTLGFMDNLAVTKMILRRKLDNMYL